MLTGLAHGLLEGLCYLLLKAGQHVTVRIQRDRYGGMPQAVTDYFCMDALCEQERSVSVTKIVQAGGYLCILRQPPEVVADRIWAERCAHFSGEDPITRLPRWSPEAVQHVEVVGGVRTRPECRLQMQLRVRCPESK